MKKYRSDKALHFYLLSGAVWMIIVIFNAFINHQRNFAIAAMNEIWRGAFLITASFLFFEYGLPVILKKRATVLSNLLFATLLLSLQILVISLGLYLWCRLGDQLNIYTQVRQSILFPGGLHQLIDDIIFEGETGLLSMFFFGSAKLFQYNFRLRQTAQQLLLEKQEAELNFLKSQTNPHFLFNTLNNIYAMARDKNDQAPESILRLSKILRFMLYETSGKFITVEKEIGIIQDYIALEQLRYDESLRISFVHSLDEPEQDLPPLLLIPLVENAFKHGTSESEGGSFIEAELRMEKKKLSFVIRNSAEQEKGQHRVKENIGLTNLRKQLRLLFKDHSLSVQHSGTVFTAELYIDLKSYVES